VHVTRRVVGEDVLADQLRKAAAAIDDAADDGALERGVRVGCSVPMIVDGVGAWRRKPSRYGNW
jgi:hypothetical protein